MANEFRIYLLHGKRSNFLFADSHVESLDSRGREIVRDAGTNMLNQVTWEDTVISNIWKMKSRDSWR